MTLPLPRNDLDDSDHKDDPKVIGRKLAKLREDAGLTQREAAEWLGVAGENTISRWETGERTPSEEMFRRAFELYTAAWYGRAKAVPRGTVREAASKVYGSRLLDRVRRFELEMARLGANAFEGDQVHERARSFLEALFSSGGTDPHEELETYLEFSLRPWVIEKMRRRGAVPRDGEP